MTCKTPLKTLALDLSTTSTGYALFSDSKLVMYGVIKPINKGLSKLLYPELQIKKIRTVATQVLELIMQINPDHIVVEEINLHKNRIGGKTLDMFHGVLLDRMLEEDLKKVIYIDSDGSKGWRTKLSLRLSEQDKIINKERKAFNKKHRGTKLPIITKKHLAERWVNGRLKMGFDVDKNSGDNDIVDAIALGCVFLKNIGFTI